MPAWLAAIAMIVMWLQGFVFAGILYGETPFWDGVRSVFGFWRLL